jgi:tRNA G37 N-methylase TrmD
VRKFVGAINGQSKFVTESFNNGYIFAWDDYTEGLTLPLYSLPFILITLNHENCPRHYHRCSPLAIYWCP